MSDEQTPAPFLPHERPWAFQSRVQPWMLECFGPETAADVLERNDRFIEEALELTQANGYSAERAHALVDYVFGRPAGEVGQEIGGVMVTLAALCLSVGKDMHAEAETELSRVWTKIDVIRAKQAAKPKGSALPVDQSMPDPASRIAAIVAALRPFADYAAARDRKPMRGMDDIIHSVHASSEFEASITLTECREAGRAIEAAQTHRALVAIELADEYRRGLTHGADDLRMSLQRCQHLQRELDAAKRDAMQAKLVASGARVALERIEGIARANLYRQTEKLEDIRPIAAQALAAIKDLIGAAPTAEASDGA